MVLEEGGAGASCDGRAAGVDGQPAVSDAGGGRNALRGGAGAVSAGRAGAAAEGGARAWLAGIDVVYSSDSEDCEPGAGGGIERQRQCRW
jgi:hypothetical protein